MQLQHLTQERDKFIILDRLDDEACCAQLHGKLFIARIGIRGGVKHKGDITQIFVLLAFAAKHKTIHLRHENIRDDQVRPQAMG